MNDLDAFQRAYGSAPQGKALVSEEEKTNQGIDDTTSFYRALEADTVSLDNSSFKTEEEGVFDRLFGQPYQRAIQRQAEIFERALGQPSLQEAMTDPAKMQESYEKSTNLGSVLFQTAANPISMVFDSASEMVMFGAEKGISWLPTAFTDEAKAQLKELSETKMGQYAINAAAEGAEAWASFEESYPNEAASLKAIFDVGVARGTGPLVKPLGETPDLIPMKIEKTGLRKSTAPLGGDDKDLYNILFKEDKKTPQQVDLTTDPQGLTGKQQQLASPEELEAIDLAKKAGVQGNKTLQQNYNQLDAYYNDLEKTLEKKIRGKERTTNWPEIDAQLRSNIKQEFDSLIQNNPKLFASKGQKQEVAKLFTEFMQILDEQGGTLQGVLVARRMFDDKVSRMGVDLSQQKLTTSSLASMAVRNAANRVLTDAVPEAADTLATMSKLIPISGKLQVKAGKEATTAVGRYVQRLGLDSLVPETAHSKIMNAATVLAISTAVSPFYLFSQAMKRPFPGKMRAKITYVKNDIIREIDKALQRVDDPILKKSLLMDRRVVYTAINAAAKEYERQVEEEENAKASP